MIPVFNLGNSLIKQPINQIFTGTKNFYHIAIANKSDEYGQDK